MPVYRWIYVLVIPFGAAMSLDAIWSFADVTNALMAFPNLIGILGLSGVVASATTEYFRRRKGS